MTGLKQDDLWLIDFLYNMIREREALITNEEQLERETHDNIKKWRHEIEEFRRVIDVLTHWNEEDLK